MNVLLTTEQSTYLDICTFATKAGLWQQSYFIDIFSRQNHNIGVHSPYDERAVFVLDAT